MARRPRFVLPGVPQHVIQRGNDRQAVFYTDDDRRCYLECLGDAARKYGCLVHAYVLMTNHVHVLATPLEATALSCTMQHLGRRYVRYLKNTEIGLEIVLRPQSRFVELTGNRLEPTQKRPST